MIKLQNPRAANRQHSIVLHYVTFLCVIAVSLIQNPEDEVVHNVRLANVAVETASCICAGGQ